MRNVTEIQQRLIALGYPVGPYGADGRFGTDSLAAYNRFLASKGRPPVEGVSMAQLNRDLFPEEQPKPIINTKGTIMNGILGSIFSGLLKNLLNWQLVQGYIRGALITVGGWIGLDGLVGASGSQTIIGALMVIIGVIFQAISDNTKKKAMDVVKAVDRAPDVEVIPAHETSTGKPIVKAA